MDPEKKKQSQRKFKAVLAIEGQVSLVYTVMSFNWRKNTEGGSKLRCSSQLQGGSSQKTHQSIHPPRVETPHLLQGDMFAIYFYRDSEKKPSFFSKWFLGVQTYRHHLSQMETAINFSSSFGYVQIWWLNANCKLFDVPFVRSKLLWLASATWEIP